MMHALHTALTIAIALTSWIGPQGMNSVRSAPRSVLQARGVGYPPRGMSGAQARLMAQRAAEVGAVRNLYARLDARGMATPTPFRYASAVVRPDGSVEVTVERRTVRVP